MVVARITRSSWRMVVLHLAPLLAALGTFLTTVLHRSCLFEI